MVKSNHKKIFNTANKGSDVANTLKQKRHLNLYYQKIQRPKRKKGMGIIPFTNNYQSVYTIPIVCLNLDTQD